MNPRILLVEDDPSFCYALSKVLGSAGYDVTTAPGYLSALEALEDGKPIDLLLTDVLMPNGINGFALARMARLRRFDLKVLYMTAFDVPTDEAIGKVLRKPITDDQLVEEVRLALAA